MPNMQDATSPRSHNALRHPPQPNATAMHPGDEHTFCADCMGPHMYGVLFVFTMAILKEALRMLCLGII